MSALIPPPDEFGLPAPWWVFRVLLPATFVLHLVFMNFVLGGTCVQAIALLIREPGRIARALLEIMSSLMPIAISLTITTGIAPLLFVQVMYGQFFYTSNVLLGFVWLGILLLLLALFYGTYVLGWLVRQARPRPRVRAGLGVLLAGLVLAIAYVFTANALLMTEPERWWDVHRGAASALSPLRGVLILRYLHNVFSAIVVAGVWIAVAARWYRRFPVAVREELVRLGLGIAAAGTVVAGVTGAWYFLTLPPALRHAIHDFASVYGMAWIVGIGLALAAMLPMGLAQVSPGRRRWTFLAAGMSVAALSCMVLAREGLRVAALTQPGTDGRPAFELARFVVRPQTGPLVLFLVTLVAGIATIAVMLRWLRAPRSSGVAPEGADPT